MILFFSFSHLAFSFLFFFLYINRIITSYCKWALWIRCDRLCSRLCPRQQQPPQAPQLPAPLTQVQRLFVNAHGTCFKFLELLPRVCTTPLLVIIQQPMVLPLVPAALQAASNRRLPRQSLTLPRLDVRICYQYQQHAYCYEHTWRPKKRILHVYCHHTQRATCPVFIY